MTLKVWAILSSRCLHMLRQTWQNGTRVRYWDTHGNLKIGVVVSITRMANVSASAASTYHGISLVGLLQGAQVKIEPESTGGPTVTIPYVVLTMLIVIVLIFLKV
jgi:hypothetical protein